MQEHLTEAKDTVAFPFILENTGANTHLESQLENVF